MNTKKMHVASAVQQNGGNSNVNLSSRLLCSAKIGQILPIWKADCIPGDHFDVNVSQFARFQPLAVPAYVNLTYRTMSVFVPYHQVFDGAESFFNNQAKFKGVFNPLPTIPSGEFVEFLLRPQVSTAATSTSGKHDFYVLTGSNVRMARDLTSVGRYFVKVLNLLGYRWKTDTVAIPTNGFNALPLLAFAHAYNCYLSYSARYNTSVLSRTLETIKRNMSNLNELGEDDIFNILSSILLTYEDSFFSAAWNTPYSQEYQTNSFFSQTYLDVANTGERLMQVGFDEETGSFTDPTESSGLSAAQVRLLMKFDDYFRRSNYAGSKDVQQIYSRFGKRIDDFRTRYPYFLGDTAAEVNIGDVTATSDTRSADGGAVIGQYAGKAISDGNAHFSFDCNDYGMLFVFAWYAPKPVYYTGCDKDVLRLQPFDFYTPELDQGFAAEVADWQINTEMANPNNVFGYMPLYSEYLYANDKIVGDFARFADFGAWHFGRTSSSLASVHAQSDALIYLPQGGTEYERIFNIVDTDLVDADTIYMTCFADVKASRPMRDFSGKAMLGDGSVDVDRNGSQLN